MFLKSHYSSHVSLSTISETKVTRALKATKNSGLQPALDWLEKHSEDPEGMEIDDNDDDANKEEGDEEGAPGGLAEAKVSSLTISSISIR